MSTAHDKIAKFMEENPEPKDQFKYMQTIFGMASEEKVPEDCRDYVAQACGYMGLCYYYEWEGKKENLHMAWINLQIAYGNGNKDILEELGMCYYKGFGSPSGDPDVEMAMKLWKEGMDAGDVRCTLRYCMEKVEQDDVDDTIIEKLEWVADHPDDPQADACAALYFYWNREGEEDLAWHWRDLAVERESVLMQSLIDEEAEQEIGEDDWHPKTDMSMFFGGEEEDEDEDEEEDEFDGYDDETEAAGAAYNPEIGEKYVIVALTDDSFRILQADASDWRSLPALIGAERCDDMRCQKFRTVSADLGLPGTLLGQLDKDAFRKPKLKLNWHASQWYDGHADLAGNMIICLEDAKYNPFSFTSKEEAQQVIDALCK